MKNGSCDFKNNNFNINNNIIKIHHKKRRAHSNKVGNSCSNYFNEDNNLIFKTN